MFSDRRWRSGPTVHGGNVITLAVLKGGAASGQFSVTRLGYFNFTTQGAGYMDQPTNAFTIPAMNNVSVVPIAPGR
jgi:hypothetical protein